MYRTSANTEAYHCSKLCCIQRLIPWFIKKGPVSHFGLHDCCLATAHHLWGAEDDERDKKAAAAKAEKAKTEKHKSKKAKQKVTMCIKLQA